MLDNLKESGLILNTSQHSDTNESCNLTSIPSSSVDSPESLNEQNSRPSTSAIIEAVPAATTSLAASASTLPYITGINPHVHVNTQAFIDDNNPFSAPVTSYKPLNRPLYTGFSSKLREKIISNQYIDMCEILEEPLTFAEEEILPFGMNRYGQVGVCPTKKT